MLNITNKFSANLHKVMFEKDQQEIDKRKLVSINLINFLKPAWHLWLRQRAAYKFQNYGRLFPSLSWKGNFCSLSPFSLCLFLSLFLLPLSFSPHNPLNKLYTRTLTKKKKTKLWKTEFLHYTKAFEQASLLRKDTEMTRSFINSTVKENVMDLLRKS